MKLTQLIFIGVSSDFFIILAACLIASSSLLIHKGLTPASTSCASKPAVPGILSHIASPFLFSKMLLSPTCQTAAAYSNYGVIRDLYNCIMHLVLTTSVSFTLLSKSRDLRAFLSTCSVWKN